MAKNDLITCNACGGSVAKGVKTCPNCGAKMKKPFSKTFNGRVLKYILILYVFIALDFTLNGRSLPGSTSYDPLASESETTTEGTTGETTEDGTTTENGEEVPTDDLNPTETTSDIPTEDTQTDENTAVQTQNANTDVQNSTDVEQTPTTNEDGTVAPVQIGQ